MGMPPRGHSARLEAVLVQVAGCWGWGRWADIRWGGSRMPPTSHVRGTNREQGMIRPNRSALLG